MANLITNSEKSRGRSVKLSILPLKGICKASAIHLKDGCLLTNVSMLSALRATQLYTSIVSVVAALTFLNVAR